MVRAARLVVPLVAYGPALVSVAVVLVRRGPAAEGWLPTVGVAAMFGLGALGLSALVLAWLPWTLERLGLRRAAAWLRPRWDEDAR